MDTHEHLNQEQFIIIKHTNDSRYYLGKRFPIKLKCTECSKPRKNGLQFFFGFVNSDKKLVTCTEYWCKTCYNKYLTCQYNTVKFNARSITEAIKRFNNEIILSNI